ncbi:FtsX-like permease family protein [Agaribacter marinus]|uniref:Lipoprotein-releasing system transmembrane protein LolC n=1 Tax=Agaribacter marinus TaxID=1431249 RepID=A0AA37SXZ1_9ALTE|nr:FtsX-like permease family protein [Agaribacter marinus]GLR70155.1 lipoprotein-releasing system transmembrane protein LolC [Agaribacter marinus]
MAYAVRLLAQGFQTSQGQGFIRFVAKMSSIGVGLGCAALIILLSVMNGFEYELRTNLLKLIPHAEFINVDGSGINLPTDIKNKLSADARLKHVFQLNKASALLQRGNRIKSAEIVGINSDYYQAKYANLFNAADLFDINTAGNKVKPILLGEGIMQALDVEVGDKIQLLLPQTSKDLSFKAPISAWFSVVGDVKLGGELDAFIAFVNTQELGELMAFSPEMTSNIEFVLHDPFIAQSFVREYGYQFNQAVYMSSWFLTKGHLFYDIQLVRTVIYIVLFLLICIACFNVVSSLVMSVKEKSKAIAILKTMGASHKQIRQIFILKGIKSTFVGAFIGCTLGTMLSIFLPDLVNAIEMLTGWEILNAGVYFTSSIPSKVVWWNVAGTFLVAVLIGLLATLYPANKAASVKPAANLH